MSPSKRILEEVAFKEGVSAVDVVARCLRRDVTRARNIYCLRLNAELRWSFGQIGMHLNITKQAAWSAANIAKSYKRGNVDFETLAAMEKHVKRLSGQDLAPVIVSRIGLPHAQAHLLAILIEAHPRILNRERICELYDYATGTDDPTSDDNIRSVMSKMRQRVKAAGLPDPVNHVTGAEYALSPDIAPWINANIRAIQLRNAA